MIRMMIADDERMIREGIAGALDWARLGIGEVLTARNGREAWELLDSTRPDIVLTDILMPGMTGLDLISRDRAAGRSTKFIILSGHDSFRFAQQAIQNDVLQYLLKPCDPAELETAVRTAIEAIGGETRRERLLEALHEKLAHALPQARLQFFRDLLAHGNPDSETFELHRELFGLQDGSCRVTLFRSDEVSGDRSDWLDLMAVREATERLIPEGERHGCLMMDGLVVLIAQIPEFRRIAALSRQIMNDCAADYQLNLTVAISREGMLSEARSLFMEARESLKHAFLLGEGRIITATDIPARVPTDSPAPFDVTAAAEALTAAVASGNVAEAHRRIQDCFEWFLRMQGEEDRIRAWSLELSMALLRACDATEREACLQEMVLLAGQETLVRMADLLIRRATALAGRRFEAVVCGHNRIIDRVLACIEENLSDETLCLSRIASEILYVNVDYLGKLFRKTTGVKFTQHLMDRRMEKARELIRESPGDLRVGELAQAVGFGANAGYFGQQFRKATGQTPKEYRLACLAPATIPARSDGASRTCPPA